MLFNVDYTSLFIVFVKVISMSFVDESDIQALTSLLRDELLKDTELTSIAEELMPFLGMGKMLRARLTLGIGAVNGIPLEERIKAAASVEMVHLASLLHDDVIDNGLIRRGKTAFWREKGTTCAILMGDYILCRAFSLLQNSANSRLVPVLVDMLQKVCNAELEQELIAEKRPENWEQSVKVARCKTGSLFAYAAFAAAAPDDNELAEALLESGFELGTAYQFADDLLDANGIKSDKTLRQDSRQNKMTAANFIDSGIDLVAEIDKLCTQSTDRLGKWPIVQDRWSIYITEYFKPVIVEFVK